MIFSPVYQYDGYHRPRLYGSYKSFIIRLYFRFASK